MTEEEPLSHDHSPTAIRRRLAEPHKPNYSGDAVLGAIDGTVTTFAVVSGVAGAGLAPAAALILGISNLVADGFSMAISNYQATETDREHVENVRREEERHIEVEPGGEREEVRQIFAAKGFEGELLEKVVDKICDDEEVWVDTMIREEYGLTTESARPFKAAWVTFFAFAAAGLVPLLPYIFMDVDSEGLFVWSAALTLTAFAVIGFARGKTFGRNPLRSALATLAMGAGAAAIAFGLGAGVEALI